MKNEQCPHCGTYCTGKSAFCNKPLTMNTNEPNQEWKKDFNSRFNKVFGGYFRKMYDEVGYSYMQQFMENEIAAAEKRAKEDLISKFIEMTRSYPCEATNLLIKDFQSYAKEWGIEL